MQLFVKVTVLFFWVNVLGLTSSTKEMERLKALIKHLEARLNFEFTFRDEDIAELTDRLNGIDKVLNETVRKGKFIYLKGQITSTAMSKASEKGIETASTLKEDFRRLRTAFTEEKSEASRFRREIPKIKNNLISINEDVEKYCKVALNNTGQLLTSFQTVEHEQKLLQSIAEQVQVNTNYDKDMSKQIKNIKTLVANLYLHIGHLFQGQSCISLKEIVIRQNGIFGLQHGIKVYCDQITDGGGWIVFQRRLNGETDFYRNWTEYKNGFGDLDREFWLGNEYLSQLTADGEHELRIEMEDFEGYSVFAKYSKFKIYPEEDNYKLEVSGYSGTAGDSLEYHNGMMFSTFDRDDDKSSTNCAKKWHGAWWYNKCHTSNLNGQYYNKLVKDKLGITWFNWKPVKKVEMKFR